MIDLKSQKTRRLIWFFVAVLWMALIFSFSGTEGEKSQQQSTIVTTIVTEVIGIEPTHKDFLKIEFTVRKAAHLCLFAGLGAIFCGYFGEFSVTKKQRLLFSVLATMAYAAVDEIHQHFVPDRAARLYDVAIDTVGGFVGAGAFLILVIAVAKIIEKTKNRKTNLISK